MDKTNSDSENREKPESATPNQGYFRDKDLTPDPEGLMTPDELDGYAQKAESGIATKGDELKGEGDHEAAESYNDAATDFAQRQSEEKNKTP